MEECAALMYHDVVPGNDVDASGFPGRAAARYKIKQDRFEEHLALLASETFTGEQEINEVTTRTGGLPLYLTFDDGGISAHSYIADALERRGWRGYFFIASKYLNSKSFLSHTQVVDLHRRGHCIGAHSHSHPPRISALPWHGILDEWTRSVHTLSEIAGDQVRTGSVPGGFYSLPVARAAAQAGITMLFTSEPTTRVCMVSDCRIIGRFAVRYDTSAQEAVALAAGTGAARARHWASWQLKRLAKAFAADRYRRLSDAIPFRS